jgi:hypothetical protein
VELCSCGDPRCSSFYAIPRFVVQWRWPAHGETVQLDASRGTLSVDVVDGEIVSVELLVRRDELRSLAARKKGADTE